MGVKLIPPGAHFVYFALKDEQFAARMGFFIHVPKMAQSAPDEAERQKLVIVRVWDEKLQAFTRLPSDSEECAYQEGVLNMDFDSKLGRYPLEYYAQWTQMSDYVSADVIDRLQPVNKVILSEER